MKGQESGWKDFVPQTQAETLAYNEMKLNKKRKNYMLMASVASYAFFSYSTYNFLTSFGDYLSNLEISQVIHGDYVENIISLPESTGDIGFWLGITLFLTLPFLYFSGKKFKEYFDNQRSVRDKLLELIAAREERGSLESKVE